MKTLEDGKDGFNSAAGLLEDNSRSELASQFREFSQQRGRFYQQLETLAAEYGDDLEVPVRLHAAGPTDETSRTLQPSLTAAPVSQSHEEAEVAV